MKRIHYISGLIISIFVGLHLLNHSMSIIGPEFHIELMNKLRLIYRNPIAETILLMAVTVQIITGLKLFFLIPKWVGGFYEKLHIWTGLYLAIFFLFHIGAIMTGRYILKLDTNLFFGVAGLNTYPLNLFFIPYYGLAILAFFGHISAIHHKKMKREIFGLPVKQQSRLILVKGTIVTLVILYGLTGRFNGIEIPEEYNIMIGK